MKNAGKSGGFAKGGKGKMFGFSGAGNCAPGMTSKQGTAPKRGFVKGGSTKMFGKTSVVPAKAK